MNKLLPKLKFFSYICAKCFDENPKKLAFFYGNETTFNNSFLCHKCFTESFNLLPIEKKKEWGFYKKYKQI